MANPPAIMLLCAAVFSPLTVDNDGCMGERHLNSAHLFFLLICRKIAVGDKKGVREVERRERESMSVIIMNEYHTQHCSMSDDNSTEQL